MNIAIESILNQYGAKILLDESRFTALAGDLLQNGADIERKAIRRMAQAHLLKELYDNVFADGSDREAGTTKLAVRMNEEGFSKEWCETALAAFGLNTDIVSHIYHTSKVPQSGHEVERESKRDRPAPSAMQATRRNLEIYLSMTIDEIDSKNYTAAQKAAQKAIIEAPRDTRALFLAAAAYEGDKRELYAKRLAEIASMPTEYEGTTIEQSINKERYLYAFYSVKDKVRVQMCLQKGASPNMLYPELAYIVKDADIFTADTTSYSTHDGFGTIFFCSVYEGDYDLVELCLKAGATMYPEKVCRLETKNPDNCANPSRCAVMSHIMRSNDLKMLQLIGSFLPEIANIEFSSRTMHIAYQNDGKIEFDNEFGHTDVYAGADQSPLSYCIEYDIGNFYDRTVSTCSLMRHNTLLPFDNVLKAGATHRYLETAKWLIANGADLHRGCDSIMFANGRPEPKYNVSLLSMAVDRGNLEMVKALLASGEISHEDLDIAITWSSHNDVTDYLIQQGASASKAPVVSKGNPQASGKKGCYIATAVYGSYDCPEVWTLRRFRDQYLQKHLLGRAFVRAYYAVSPTIVRCFRNRKSFNSINRKALNAWIRHLHKEGYEDTPYFDS